MKYILIFFALIISLAYSTAAEQKTEHADPVFLLPVDWSTKKHIDLCVRIPQGYQSIQSGADWVKEPMIEFIPQGEDHFCWSEIITVQRSVGQGISADQVASFIKKGISAVAKCKILLDKKSRGKYQTVFFILSYSYKGEQEIIGVKYLSGPSDCGGVQYTIRPSKEQSEEEVVKKIECFFDKYLTVVES